MVKISTIFQKVKRKWMKIRLQPIRVFCLHHVCECYDEEWMCLCDWMTLDNFKQKVLDMKAKGYEFISLTVAHQHLQNDCFRTKKYAVLTFDDGYKSLVEVLPWLEYKKIPAVLFINGKYLDGKSYREKPKEQYLTQDELFSITSPFIEIGHHGWEHTAVTNMSNKELLLSLKRNDLKLSGHMQYIPFWAYTWGIHTEETDRVLSNKEIIPVYMNGMKNYTFEGYINRELLK